MVVLDADRQVVQSGEAVERHRERARRRLAVRPARGGRAAWAAAVGSVPVASFTVTKLSWLHRKEPEAWERIAHVVLPHDWLTSAELTGRFTTDRGDASGTGYWSPATGEYRFDLLARRRRRSRLDAVVPRGARTERARRQVAGARWSRRAPATTWRRHSVSALRPGDAVVSIGTSGTVFTRVATGRPPIRRGAVAGFADATGRFLPLVCTLNAAKVIDAVRGCSGWITTNSTAWRWRVTRARPHVAAVLRRRAHPEPPDATGVLGGLRTDVTREQLARAAVDGVVCGLLDALDALAAHCCRRADRAGRRWRALGRVPAVFAGLCDRPVS